MKIKRMANSDRERRARDVLSSLLTRVHGLKIKQVLAAPPPHPIPTQEIDAVHQYRYSPDLAIHVTIGNEQEEGGNTSSQTAATCWQLCVEVAGQVDERHTQSVAAYARDLPCAVPVLFVPHLSAQALEMCRTLGVCCADNAGNAWIALGDRVYIERIGNKTVSPGNNRSLPLLSSPKTENVLRVLLNEIGAPRRVWRLQSLADEAGVSLGQAARVKDILEAMGVTEEQSKHRRVGGFRLAYPEEVLSDWANYVRARNYRIGEEHKFHAVNDPVELQRMLTRKLPSFVTDGFALSGHQAAEVYAPYARSPVFSAYFLPAAEVDMNTIEAAMDLDRVESGTNVVLTIPRNPGVFYLPPDLRESSGARRLREGAMPVVSPIQTYLDLQRLDGRAREGAQHLLKEYLRPRWQQEATNHD